MTDSPSSLALRDLRADFTNPKGLAALAGVSLLAGISGPFETFTMLSTAPRVLYWSVVVFATYAAGAYVNTFLHYRGGLWLETSPARLPIMGLATGCAVMIVLLIINTAAFGWIYPTFGSFLTAFAFIVLISYIVVGLLMLLAPLPDAQTSPPNIMDRIALEKRGALVSLSVQDHYVQVVTTRGTDMILMRLSDAIRETGETPGLQVHRSHWVATGQVIKVNRTGERAVLRMSAGPDIPASRSYIPALRDAGLLAKPVHG